MSVLDTLTLYALENGLITWCVWYIYPISGFWLGVLGHSRIDLIMVLTARGRDSIYSRVHSTSLTV
jgi:hypothetical protein